MVTFRLLRLVMATVTVTARGAVLYPGQWCRGETLSPAPGRSPGPPAGPGRRAAAAAAGLEGPAAAEPD